MGNQKIIVDIHEIMQQMGIQRDAFEISDRKHADSGFSHEPADDRIHDSQHADIDEPRSAPKKQKWQTDLAELIVASL